MRFYKPGQSQYLSQFAGLPLDWMYESIKGLQAEKDAVLSGAEAMAFPVDHLPYGEAGIVQSMRESAMALSNEYDQETEKIVNMMNVDPRSSHRAAAELAKLDNKFKNDPRVKLHAQMKADYALEQETKRKAKDYAASVYGRVQPLYTDRPYDEKGNIVPFTTGQEFATTQNWITPMSDLVADIATDKTASAGLYDFANMGLAHGRSSTEYLYSPKVKSVVNAVVVPFLNTTEGQYYKDKFVEEYYPQLRTKYHMTDDVLASTPVEGMEIPLEYKSHKDKKGNVVYDKDENGQYIVTKKRQGTLYDAVSQKAAEDAYAIAMKQETVKQDQDVGFSGYYPGLEKSDLFPGANLIDRSSATTGGQAKAASGQGSLFPGIKLNKDGIYETDVSTLQEISKYKDFAWTAGPVVGLIGLALDYIAGEGNKVTTDINGLNAFMYNLSLVDDPNVAKSILNRTKPSANEYGGVEYNLKLDDAKILADALNERINQSVEGYFVKPIQKNPDDVVIGGYPTLINNFLGINADKEGSYPISTIARQDIQIIPIIPGDVGAYNIMNGSQFTEKYFPDLDEDGLKNTRVYVNGTLDKPHNKGAVALVGIGNTKTGKQYEALMLDPKLYIQADTRELLQYQTKFIIDKGLGTMTGTDQMEVYIPLTGQGYRNWYTTVNPYNNDVNAHKNFADQNRIPAMHMKRIGNKVQLQLYDPNNKTNPYTDIGTYNNSVIETELSSGMISNKLGLK